MSKLTVKQDEANEVPAEVMAGAIVEISKAMKKITESRLSRDAVVALIKDRSGITKSTINIVLNNLDSLEIIWLKKKQKGDK